MANEEKMFVKNAKTGVVFTLTEVLKKMRPDLIPCTKDGIPTQYGHIDMPYLFNPFSDSTRVIPNEGEAARIPGLIPCRDQEHADAIKASLLGLAVETPAIPTGEEQGLKAPPAHATIQSENQELNTVTEDGPVQDDGTDKGLIDKLLAINIENFDKPQLKEFALETFGESLDGRLSEDAMREQVQIMINGKLAEAA